MNPVIIGNAVLYNADCRDVLPMLTEVDAVVTDPPYGTTAAKWDVVIPFDSMWELLNQVVKPECAVLLFGKEPFSSQLRMSNIKDYRYDWYWQKDKGSNFLFGNVQPMNVIELISVFYKKQPTYNSQKIINSKGVSTRHLSFGKGLGNSDRSKSLMYMPDFAKAGMNYEPDKLLANNLIYCSREQRDRVHPTQKPVALMEYLIRTYTNKDESVLDITMGSGTTGVAAVQMDRKFIGIELDNQYFDIACQRIEDAQRQSKLF
jgi:site-specific DNA-methyltransferase (adenine-specific)